MSVLPAGFGVLVTRPVEQAHTLCELIETAGGIAIRLPLLAIEPAQLGEHGPRRLLALDHTDWLIFISANAVRCAFALLGPHWRRPADLKIAAIGQATAAELSAIGLEVDLSPQPPFNSETLLAQPAWEDATGLRFLIVRGEGGRELLAETLRERGGSVDYAEVYRRVLPTLDVNDLMACWQEGKLKVVTLTSGEALDNLWQQLPENGRKRLLNTPMVVIGQRLGTQARALGATHVFEVEAKDTDLFNAVVRLAQHIN